MKMFLFRWGPALGLMIVIFIFSAQPRGTMLVPDFKAWDFAIKKTAHVIEYALLAALMLRGARGESPLRPAHWLWAAALTLLYALTDEYHQTFVAGREGHLVDVGIDAVGVTIGLTLRYWRTRALLPSPNKSEPRRR